MRYALPKILAVLTRHDRQLVNRGVDFEWGTFWTYNLFRAYEMIFGRRYGIKCESYKKQGGWQVGVTYECQIVLFELAVRQFFSTFKLPRIRFEYVPILRIQTPIGVIEQKLAIPYLFAIAFDAVSISNHFTNSGSLSFTVTGSNTTLFSRVETQKATSADIITAVTYNSVALGQQTKVQLDFGGGNFDELYLYALAGPTTGSSLTLAFTQSAASADTNIQAVSYSGTDQSGTFNAASRASSIADPSVVTITIAGTNSWAMGSKADGNSASITTVTTGTVRLTGSDPLWDSNGTVAAGSYSFSYSSGGGTANTAIICEIKVAASAAVVSPSIISDLILFT